MLWRNMYTVGSILLGGLFWKRLNIAMVVGAQLLQSLAFDLELPKGENQFHAKLHAQRNHQEFFF